jgi:hypothetical protein
MPAPVCCSFKDKEVQRDAKMVSYKVVDKGAKPYVEVDVAGEKKVRFTSPPVTSKGKPC